MSHEFISTDALLNKIEQRFVAGSGLDAPALLLINERKQCHELKPESVDRQAASLVFPAPGGRVAPLDPERGWVLVVQSPEGAFRVSVKTLKVEKDRIACFLPEQGEVLARRSSMRFSPRSRNPVQVSFVFGSDARQASLVDFSMVGIGIWLAESCGSAVGTTIGDGVFVLRGVPVHFSKAEVVHQKEMDGGHRLGLAFCELSESDQTSIAQAFEACARSHSYVSSMRVDG